MKSTTLLVMRHAKSDWNTGQTRDFDRTLSERGKRDAPRIGQWIANQGYSPDRVISSPARRVRETIFSVGKAWRQDQGSIVWEQDIYNASLDQLLGIIAGDLVAGKINLLIGHNPGVSELILYLSGDQVPANIGGNLMPTAAVAVLQQGNAVNPVEYGSWKIIDYMKPRLLADNN